MGQARKYSAQFYLALPEEERVSLPDDIGPCVDAPVGHALKELGEFREVLAEAFARIHAESAERFIKDLLGSRAGIQTWSKVSS